VELFDRLGDDWEYTLIAGNRSLHTRNPVHRTSGTFRAVPTTPYRGNGVDRILNWLSYAIGALFVGMRQRHVDVAYASSPQLLTGLAGYLLARFHRAGFVLEVRDLWPRILVDMGRMKPTSLIYRLARRLELFLYKKADEIIVLAQGAQRAIQSDCAGEKEITFVPNGADLGLFSITETRETMRQHYGMDGLVFVYTGAHGPANGLGLLLDAAERVRDDLPDLKFWLIGDGLQKPALMQLAAARGLTNVRFLDPIAKSEIPRLLRGADVGLHILDDVPLFRYGVSPSKLMDYMASGLPVVTNCQGEVGELVIGASAGLAVGPNDLEEAIRTVASASQEQLQDWGESGRAFIEEARSSDILAKRLQEVLDRVAAA
jgi:glycosyltransferase involved in cell wall biosynthesis